MTSRGLLYYITDRSAFPGDEHERRGQMIEKIAEAAACGVDYIQLREKDLPTRELEPLARDAMQVVQRLRIENRKPRTAFLVNSRTDVAVAVGADGVHLRSDDVSPEDVRAVWKGGAGTPFDKLGAGSAREPSTQEPLIGVSCHSMDEIAQAAANRASFAVFAPVFEKQDAPSAGLEALREACREKIPVLALGGVTLENAETCLQAGAGGIAGIRLFQENSIFAVVRTLRG